MSREKTIMSDIHIKGKGLHSGKNLNVNVKPAEAGKGIHFIRTDLKPEISIPALANYVGDTSRSTSIRDEKTGASVLMIEHVMAAFAAMGISNITIETDGGEFPVLDGCSEQMIKLIKNAGITTQNKDRKIYILPEEIHYSNENKSAELHAYPSDHFQIEVNVDYHTEVLNKQRAVMNDVCEIEKGFAVCRTFCFLHEIWPLIQNDLIKGGSLDNAIVYVAHPLSDDELLKISKFFKVENIHVDSSTGVLSNTKLHFDNEAARHKLLDLVGDLNLLGVDLQAKIIANSPGHFVNTQFAGEIFRYMQQHPEYLR